MRRTSLQYLERAIELVFLAATSKPHRMVEVEELKQPSLFAQAAALLEDAGVPRPQKWRWVGEEAAREGRREFLGGLRGF